MTMKITELNIQDRNSGTEQDLKDANLKLNQAKVSLADNLLEHLAGQLDDEIRRVDQDLKVKCELIKTLETDNRQNKLKLIEEQERLDLVKTRHDTVKVIDDILGSISFISPQSRAYLTKTVRDLYQFSKRELIERLTALNRYLNQKKP